MPELGKLLVVFGALIVGPRLALWTGFGAGWLGRLPGDIRIERGNSSFYFPIVTCIIHQHRPEFDYCRSFVVDPGNAAFRVAQAAAAISMSPPCSSAGVVRECCHRRFPAARF